MAGWIGFAAVMMLIVGILDFIEGLIAIVRDNYFLLTSSQLIVFDTTTWGWITLIWGLSWSSQGSRSGQARIRPLAHGRAVQREHRGTARLARWERHLAVDAHDPHAEHRRDLRARRPLGRYPETVTG
jgi:hypothetical protein